MKKKNLILIIVTVLVIALGFFLVYSLAFKKPYSNLSSINVSELEKKISNKEKFILVITQTGCSHCEQYLPELNRTLKEVHLKAYALNITDLSGEETSMLSKYVSFSGTPTTIFFNEGEETTTLNRIVGYASKEKIKDKLQSLGYVD